MAKRFLPSVLGSLVCLVVLGTQSASGQFPYNQPATNPYARPTISPYLNLARPGSPAINYYGLVRPEQRFYAGFLQLSQQVAANQQQLERTGAEAMEPNTGHSAYFMNLSHYYSAASPPVQGVSPALSPSNRPAVRGSFGASIPRR